MTLGPGWPVGQGGGGASLSCSGPENSCLEPAPLQPAHWTDGKKGPSWQADAVAQSLSTLI